MGDNFFTSAKVRLRNIAVWNALGEFYERNPHIMLVRGIAGMSISYREVGGVLEAEIFPEYEMFMNVIIAHERSSSRHLTPQEREVYDLARRVVSQSRGSTTWDTAHALHFYLKDNIEFEHNHESNPHAFDVYGALIQGRAVCQGYAQSYRMLLHLAGIESQIVTGVAGGESHAWNLVNYGSATFPEWYHVDVTWNDPDEMNSHKFFNVSDAILSHTHVWARDFFPAATSQRLNYFRHRELVLESLWELEPFLTAAVASGATTIEVVCTFRVTNSDLGFLSRISPAEHTTFAVTPYGSDFMLTVLISE
jgi:hypothetical protein